MKLLLVEDNPKLSASVKEGLEQEGYAVTCLFDGPSVLRELNARGAAYDAVILDVMLPGKSGLDACREMREQGKTVPVLMLTAMGATGDKVRGLDAGADDYLAKPFDFEELLARLRALLRRPRPLVPVTLTLGPISFHATDREATVSGRPLGLTLRESSILEYLMRHPNQVVPRDRLYAHVWDVNDDSQSNVMDVHIKNLRKKLGTYGFRLKTVRGIGYRLA